MPHSYFFITLNQTLDRAYNRDDEELLVKVQRIQQSLQWLQLEDTDDEIMSLQDKLQHEVYLICNLLKRKYGLMYDENVSAWLLSIE